MWIHARWRYRHLLEYILVRKCDQRDVLVTKAMCSIGSWTNPLIDIFKGKLQPQAVGSVINQTEAAEETKNLIRHQVSSRLMTHKPREIFPKVERDALRELKADMDIVIVPADNGRSTVVLGKTDYLQKAKDLLEDCQFYVPCETNPVKTLTREIKATLLALENSGAMTSTDRRMREPKKRPWPDSMDLSIEAVELLLRNKYNGTENRLGHAQILRLLKFCLRTYFTLDGPIYEQVNGTPLGSPISGFIVEAVLQLLESLVVQHHRPKFRTRYVDDTFVVIERDQVQTFKERLNSLFPDIQFTMEE
nr:unnamed protein product [Spirometra erinaceieuropaei]